MTNKWLLAICEVDSSLTYQGSNSSNKTMKLYPLIFSHTCIYMHTYTYIHMHTHNKYACMHIYTQVHTYCDSHLFYTNVAIYICTPAHI